jgi:hypothetical protein
VDYGTQLNLSAQVEPSADVTALQNCQGSTTVTCPTFTMPTGTVAFSDNSTALNTAVINAEGDAEYNAPFAIGAHSVTATYAGDDSYNASTASAIAFTVVQDTPQIYLGASNQTNDTQLIQVIGGTGQPTVLNVLVENGAQVSSGARVGVLAPTGTVTVTGFPSGVPTSAALSAGVDSSTGAVAGIGTITIPASTAANTYTVSIGYSGDTNYAAVAAQSGTVQIASNGLTASTTTASISGSISPTTSIVVTGTVTGAGSTAPTGDVYVYASGNYVAGAQVSAGTGDVSNFSIVLNSQTLAQGVNYVTIQYFGDSKYNPSAYTLSTAISNPLSDFTLTPQTTIVPVTAGSTTGGTAVVNLASINGFSGAVSLTCAAPSGITCTGPSSETLVSAGSASATLTLTAAAPTVDGTYNVLVTGTDPTGAYVHTLNISAIVTGGVAPTPGFTLNSNSPVSLDAGATTGNSAAIGITPSGGFTGAVTLTCAITASPSGATSPVTCTPPSTPVEVNGASAQFASLTLGSTSTTTSGAYTVTVTGTFGSTTETTPVTVNVGVPGIVLATTPSPATITVSPGATTGNTAAISVTPKNGFTAAVTLTCAVTTSISSPTDPPTCTLSPASFSSFTGTTAQTSTVTVSTTAATSARNQVKKLFWPSAGGATLALLLFFGLPKRRRNWLAMLGLMIFFVAAAGMGCGGGGGGGAGGGGGGGGSTGTTAGSYTVTVTATSGTGSSAITQTTTVAVTVN